MSLVVTIPNLLIYGKISQYLAAKDVSRNWYYKGGDLTSTLSRQIQDARKLVEFAYDANNSDETLEDTGRYLYSLCGKYISQARRIVNAGGEGNIVNPSTGQNVAILGLLVQFVVGDSSSPTMSNGDTQLVLNYSGIDANTLSIDVDGTEIPVNRSDRFSYTAVVGGASATITFNSPVTTDQLIMVHAIRQVAV